MQISRSTSHFRFFIDSQRVQRIIGIHTMLMMLVWIECVCIKQNVKGSEEEEDEQNSKRTNDDGKGIDIWRVSNDCTMLFKTILIRSNYLGRCVRWPSFEKIQIVNFTSTKTVKFKIQGEHPLKIKWNWVTKEEDGKTERWWNRMLKMSDRPGGRRAPGSRFERWVRGKKAVGGRADRGKVRVKIHWERRPDKQLKLK